MDERPAWPAPPNEAEPAPTAPPTPEPLARYRPLQVASILLIVGGLIGLLATVVANYDLMLDGATLPSADEAVTLLIGLLLSGLALVVGLLMNAIRALIVRGPLPVTRYRGPSIVVLLLLGTVVTGIGSAAVAGELLALQSGGPLSPVGTLLLLTITQAGLLAVVAAFVVVPRALVGVRVLPARGPLGSALFGLLLAVPAWIGALAASVAVGIILERLFDLRPDAGIAGAAILRADPVVLVVALVVVAPIAEEIFFRGVVYNAWEREYGPIRALFGSALLFAFIHGSVFLLVPIFGLGVILALVYQRTRSLLACMALHAGYNAITVTLGLLDRFDVIRLPT